MKLECIKKGYKVRGREVPVGKHVEFDRGRSIEAIKEGFFIPLKQAYTDQQIETAEMYVADAESKGHTVVVLESELEKEPEKKKTTKKKKEN